MTYLKKFQCDGSHVHSTPTGKALEKLKHYPVGVCNAVVKGIIELKGMLPTSSYLADVRGNATNSTEQRQQAAFPTMETGTDPNDTEEPLPRPPTAHQHRSTWITRIPSTIVTVTTTDVYYHNNHNFDNIYNYDDNSYDNGTVQPRTIARNGKSQRAYHPFGRQGYSL